MTGDVTFGFNIPTFAGGPGDGGEVGHIDTPSYDQLDWETTKRGVLKAEELGFDSVWAPDHMVLGRDNAILECWTLLSAVAGMADDVRIGPLVLCNDFRNPALVAKMAATLDVISDGRLELGLGAGSYPTDYHAYGWEHRDGFTRLMRLDESIRLIKRLWAADPGEPVSFDGDHYQLDDAYCAPGPVQDPHPPIMVGGVGEDVTLKLVAKHADAWNTMTMGGQVDVLEHKIDVIEDHCETVGRDPEEIEYTWEGLVLPTRDPDTLDRVLDLLLPMGNGDEAIETKDDLQEYIPVGTPEECAEIIERRIDAGITTFQWYFLDFPGLEGMELFADEILPQFS